jgi:hypothetical protein
MILVAIAAALLALPDGLRVVAAVLSLPCLALFTAWRLLLGGHRRLAAIGFWGMSTLANVLFVAVCAFPGILSFALFVLWLFILLPSIAGFGAAWAILATRGEGVTRRSNQLTWMLVIALAVMPGVTAWTVWPFRLEFLTARSSLERVADRIAAGQAISYPQWAGPFRLLGSRVDSETGGVALLTDLNPGGPSGFVRHKGSRTEPYRCFGPIRGDRWHVGLGDGWCYHEED